MFKRLSLREQRFYNDVAKMVKKINENSSTIKSEIYRTGAPLRYHALLHKVVLNYPLLNDIAGKAGLAKHSAELGSILACELLAGRLRNEGYRKKLKSLLGGGTLKEAENRVFIRLNTLKASEDDFKDYNLVRTCVPSVFHLADHAAPGEDTQGLPSTRKTIRDLYRDSALLKKVKIQNLSSCLPAFVLNPLEHSTVVDATAAPGNKTTHLCSIMNNTGRIYAFERNQERFSVLQDQIAEYGATNVTAQNMDFLTVEPSAYQADYILLDPSCSGSGIHINYEKVQKRIDSLHNLQAMFLNHTFKFNPKKVVYSTCSVHAEEGEDVVKEALEKNPDYEIEPIGDFWKTRGHPGYAFSDDVIRAGDEEGTIGFFVALFRRKNTDEINDGR